MTVELLLNQRLLKLGIKPSEFSEPERQVILEQTSTFENEIAFAIMPQRETFSAILVEGIKEYSLDPRAAIVEKVKINGQDISANRVNPNTIITG